MCPCEYQALARSPGLVADLLRALEPTGHAVEHVSFPEFDAIGRALSDQSRRIPQFDCGELIIELQDFEQFDGVMASAFGGDDGVLRAHVLETFLQRHPPRPPWPRLLVPKGEPGEPDIRTFLGSDIPIPYMRWNLDELFGVGSLAGFSLYEPDATLIRELIRGADLRRLEQVGLPPGDGTDCERLAGIAEAAVMAARHAPGPPAPENVAAIARMCELRDDSLERAVLLAVGYALAVAYDPRWWSIVERIGLDRLCAEVGLKRDRCGELEAALWSRLRRGLTRIDRWYDLPASQADADEIRGESPVRLPTTGEILQKAMADAQAWFRRPLGDLRFRRAMPELLGGDRPVLVALKADYGWDVRYIDGEQPPRQAQVRELRGRLSRILLPLMRKMAEDIEGDVPVGECGWVPLGRLDPGCGGKASDKFRKDKSDLIVALKPTGLGIESGRRGRIRLARCLVDERARIEIHGD